MKKVLFGIFLVSMQAITVAAGAEQLPFISDSFAKARAEALHRRLPIFVECWAPW